ncbi:MAG: hypothetical protein ACUVX9_16540 [Anaerolineae bacterium]
MAWTSWMVLPAIALASAALGALVHARRIQLLQAGVSLLLRLRRCARPWLQKRTRQPSVPAPKPRCEKGDIVVLIPDGRPWPLEPAVHLLELAWRWQVVHGSNLPLRARQGEGAYVWRPPLPARSALEQASHEAERQR